MKSMSTDSIHETSIRRVKCWVINLDQSVDRLFKITVLLNRFGFRWERFPAIRGSELSASEFSDLVSVNKYLFMHGRVPLPGEVGCFASHMKVLNEFLLSADDFALVLEDDVSLDVHACDVINSLLDDHKSWDLVKLSGMHSGTPLILHSLTSSHSLAIPLTQFTGSSAYLINRFAAFRLLNGMKKMVLPFDHDFDRTWVHSFKLRMVTPLVFHHNTTNPSTIEYHSNVRKRKFNFFRLSALFFRIATELVRIVHRSIDWVWHR